MYYLEHVQKIPQLVDVRRYLVPNVLDQSFEEWVQLKFPKDELLKIAERRFATYVANNNIHWKHPLDQRDCLLNLRRGAFNLEFYMRQDGLCVDNAVTQLTLKVYTGRLKLTGRLDVVYPGIKLLMDLKTTENKQWLDVNQLHYYALLVFKQLGIVIEEVGFLAPLIEGGCIQRFPVTKADYRHQLEEIEVAAQRVFNQDFPATGYPERCFTCMMKHVCEVYKGKVATRQTDKGVKPSFYGFQQQSDNKK
jgi:hypothetical protein